MKVWLLRPHTGDEEEGLWDPWYDKAFGFVVAAETEQEARQLASEQAGDEHERAWRLDGQGDGPNPWLDPALTACTELRQPTEAGVILRDLRSA